MKGKNEYFVPLEVERKNWRHDKPFIFLDKIFEKQFSKDELSKLEYTTIEPFGFKYTKEQIDFFKAELIAFFAVELNSFHNVNFDFNFWNKLFTPYFNNCITNIFSKVEELNNLFMKIKDSSFESFSHSRTLDSKFLKEFGGLFSNEKYNNFIFAKIAQDYFGFNIVYADQKDEKCNIDEKEVDKNCHSKTFIEKLKNITLKKLILFIINNVKVFFLKKPQMLLWCTYFSGEANNYFARKSNGRIRQLTMNNIDSNPDTNLSYRENLRKQLLSYFDNRQLPLEKKIFIELLPEILPYFYIENFKKYLKSADSFLKQNKSVKCFFATCTYCRETQPFLFTYAQTKGIRILTEMHGGDYGIMDSRHDMECLLNDVLYSWGKWGYDVYDTSCSVLPAPAYRQHLLYNDVKKEFRYILFLGSWNEYNISSWQLYLAGHAKVHDSMNSEVEFFKNIDKSVIKNILVRNYFIDFGYHFNDFLSSEIPDINIQNYSQKDYDENFDPVERNANFATTLLNCSLILVNEFETCFIEALYCEKPYIILFNKYGLKLRKEEIQYFKMMEDVGLLFYDWNEAAKLINKIHNNISEWWFEPERQKVVKIIRERYAMKVPDINKWWYKEFMRQIKISKKELKERKKNGQ